MKFLKFVRYKKDIEFLLVWGGFKIENKMMKFEFSIEILLVISKFTDLIF